MNESLNYRHQKKRLDELNNNLISKEKSPEESFFDSELSEKIQNGLMVLNPNYRALIILKHFQNCSYQDMGYILDLPEKTVKSRLFTARKLLKDVLIKKGILTND